MLLERRRVDEIGEAHAAGGDGASSGAVQVRHLRKTFETEEEVAADETKAPASLQARITSGTHPRTNARARACMP